MCVQYAYNCVLCVFHVCVRVLLNHFNYDERSNPVDQMQRVDVNSVLLQITHIPLSDPGGLRQSATSSHLSHLPHPVCLSDGKSPHISRNKRSFLQASFFFFFFYVPFNLTSSRFFYTSHLRLEQILIDIPPVDP